MTEEKLDQALRKLDSIEQELKGFNGSPGLCKRVCNLERIVRRIIYALCTAGGGTGIFVGIEKLIGMIK